MSDVTNFPKKGNDSKVGLSTSRYPQFDFDFAERVKRRYPEIWKRGGNDYGNQAYDLWKRARRGEKSEEVLNWIRKREAWAARHYEDYRINGVIAQMKWGVIGSRGESHMKNMVKKMMDKEDSRERIEAELLVLESDIDIQEALTFKEVDYRVSNSPARCSTCSHFRDGVCDLLEEDVDPDYTCNRYSPQGIELDQPPSASSPVTEQAVPLWTWDTISETTVFEGEIPFLRTPDDININELTQGDPDPVFVTLRIAQVGKLSGNGLLYDRPLVNQIVEQINRKRVGGIMGHIKAEEYDISFPTPKVLWLSAVMIGDDAYAKGYIRDPETSRFIRQLKAVHGSIGTSIYGRGLSEQKDGKNVLKSFVLESLDFAPMDRAALPVGGKFRIARETIETSNPLLQNKEMMMAEQNINSIARMTDEELMKEMGEARMQKLAEAYRNSRRKSDDEDMTEEMDAKKKRKGMTDEELMEEMGEDRVKKIAEAYAKKMKMRIVNADSDVAEMTNKYQTITLEGTIRKQSDRIAELSAMLDGYERQAFDTGIDALMAELVKADVSNREQRDVLEALRAQVKGHVIAELNGSRDLNNARLIADSFLNSPQFQPIYTSTMNAIKGYSLTTIGPRISANATNSPTSVIQALDDIVKGW